MKKYEVLVDTVINVKKGSIVIVSDKQFELKRNKLKPLDDKKEVKEVKVEEIETRVLDDEQPKRKQVRKK